ncbi:MAG: hypothetical protein WCX74_02680 [Candidatus Paceibacterota bacterium]
MKKHILVLSFIALSLFGSIQLANASCSLQSLKECNREGLLSIIIDLIKTKQIGTWKEYKNNELGFSFKYPSFLTQDKNNNNLFIDNNEVVYLRFKTIENIANYKIEDVPGAITMRFDLNQKKWTNGYSEGPIPKRMSGNIEAYLYQTGDGPWGTDIIAIFNSDYSKGVEITIDIRGDGDEKEYKSKKIDPSLILLGFKYLSAAEKLTDKNILAKFKATEIVSNNLPESIEFWTESYCPGNGFNYNYKFEGSDMYRYSFDSCEQGDTGSHGGCKACIMSKIKLIKSSECEGNKKQYYQVNGKNIFVQLEGVNNCDYYQIRIYGGGIDQKIEGHADLSFNNDYNFDGYKDISVLVDVAQNNSYGIYLYNQKENKYIFNEKLSELSDISVDANKKEIISFWKGGVGWWSQDAYKYVDGKIILFESYQCNNGCFCENNEKEMCPTHIVYDLNGNVLKETSEQKDILTESFGKP